MPKKVTYYKSLKVSYIKFKSIYNLKSSFLIKIYYSLIIKKISLNTIIKHIILV
ncbi:uncharacterized protein TRIREDRAFT_112558 [Trichoderma reesei QM6a]|uniref:Predicted protein n=1 Tax=Hypocrea jecorina (strain QM6a) TaxID=431241 RepID=G0RXD3_HYPJQ|nr:uncharacterized protein TRIREDRAFT_112558 [Trichoderma reesei QM6a]EGR44178.1 predicted protein [Trichoderma reesei QM6a]